MIIERDSEVSVTVCVVPAGYEMTNEKMKAIFHEFLKTGEPLSINQVLSLDTGVIYES